MEYEAIFLRWLDKLIVVRDKLDDGIFLAKYQVAYILSSHLECPLS